MLPQTMFAVAANPECPCPPTVVGTQLILGPSFTYHIPSSPQNDFAPTDLSQISRLNLTTAGDSVITGLPAQQDGALLVITNLDATDTITLSHDDALSADPNRIYLPGGVDLVLGQYNSATLLYDETLDAGVGKWLLISSN